MAKRPLNRIESALVGLQTHPGLVKRGISDARDRERGAALSEYGVLLLLVGIASFAILGLVGRQIYELFAATEDEFTRVRPLPGS